MFPQVWGVKSLSSPLKQQSVICSFHDIVKTVVDENSAV